MLFPVNNYLFVAAILLAECFFMANLLACSKSIASLVLCVVRRFVYVPERNGNINRPTTLNTRLVGCKDSVCLQLATIISDKLFTLFTSNINLKYSPFWNTMCLINNHYSNCARMQFALEIKRFIPSLQDMNASGLVNAISYLASKVPDSHG